MFKTFKIEINKYLFVILLLSVSSINSKSYLKLFLLIAGSLIMVYLGCKLLVKSKLSVSKSLKMWIVGLVFLNGVMLLVRQNFKYSASRYMLFVYVTLVGLLVCHMLNGKDICAYFYSYFVVNIILILVYYLLFKSESMQGNQLKSFYYEKNGLAAAVVLGIPVFLHFYNTRKSKKAILWLGISISIILFSRSTTGIIIMCAYLILNFIPKHFKIRLLKFGFFTPCLLFLYMKFHDVILASGLNSWIYHMTGKTLAFTGRDVIWNFSIHMIKEHPFLGYGFLGLWKNESLLYSSLEKYNSHFVGGHAHNGFFEVLLSCGIIGILILYYLFYREYKCLKNTEIARSIGDFEILWFMQILFGIIIQNELMSAGLLWCLFIYGVYRAESLRSKYKNPSVKKGL